MRQNSESPQQEARIHPITYRTIVRDLCIEPGFADKHSKAIYGVLIRVTQEIEAHVKNGRITPEQSCVYRCIHLGSSIALLGSYGDQLQVMLNGLSDLETPFEAEPESIIAISVIKCLLSDLLEKPFGYIHPEDSKNRLASVAESDFQETLRTIDSILQKHQWCLTAQDVATLGLND